MTNHRLATLRRKASKRQQDMAVLEAQAAEAELLELRSMRLEAAYREQTRKGLLSQVEKDGRGLA